MKHWLIGGGLLVLGLGGYAGYDQRDDHTRVGTVDVYTLNLGLSNVHVLGERGHYVLIDAGPAGQEQKVETRLRQLGIAPRQIAALVLTHGHADHAGGARYWQQRYGTPVLAGACDTAMLRRGHNDSLVTHTWLDRFTRRFIVPPSQDAFPGLRPSVVVTDSLDLRRYGLAATVHALPGHTPGSVMVAVGRAAFVGDSFRGALLARHAPREHFFQPSLTVAHHNIQALMRRGYTRFYLGHGGWCEAGAVRRQFGPGAQP